MQPTEEESVHGIVANVSPMKKGATAYFEAKICDEDKQIRLVGFSPNQRKRLANCQDTMNPVALSNVKVKRAKNSDDLEVLLKHSSQVQMSPKKISQNKVAKLMSNNIKLVDLEKRNDYDRVTVTAKVIRIEDPVKVSPVLRKQNITIADTTTAVKLTLWEDAIGKLTLNKTYQFTQFTVRTYQSEKYLSLPREGATFVEVEDMGVVAEDDLPDDSVLISQAKVVAATITTYSACLACNSKVQEIDTSLAQCTKCSMQQLIENSTQHTSANILVNTGAQYIQLSAFDDVLCDIVGGEDITVPNLLTAPSFNATYRNKLLIAVTRFES